MKKLLPLLVIALSLYLGSLSAQQAFTELSAAAGINHAFVIDQATFGGGACVIDFDNDGYEDLYVTGGSVADKLYKNNGDGTFTDILAQAGFERTLETYTQGAAAADINRDGYKDLIVTTMNFLNDNRTNAPNLLYLNNGDGTFTEVTEAWDLEGERVNSMGASFGDINNDGYPDLFVCNYFSNSATGISVYNEETITNSFRPAIDYLYINLGGQRFVEVSNYYGLDHVGFGFLGMFTDFDNDQDLDLYIANDFGFKSTPNMLFQNEYPVKKMNNRSISLALNYGMNAMGIAPADLNFDGYMDYYVTNLGTSLFTINDQGRGFIDQTLQSGIGIPTIKDSVYTGPPISWGANFFDFDHDTDMDLFVSNGALNPTVRPNPNFFFENQGGKMHEVSAEMQMNDYRIGRGSVVFDYDNDGDLDLFVVNQVPRTPSTRILEARCLLYRNDASEGNWLKVALEGVGSDKNGLGARVEAVVDGKLLIREIDGGSSHLSQNSTIAHFGLGNASSVESITVKWPGKGIQTLTNISANQQITIQETSENTSGSESKNRFNVSPGYFTSEVLIEYELADPDAASLRVFDVQGRLVANLGKVDQPLKAGFWRWEVPANLQTGVYIFQIETENGVMAKRAIKR
ncbi:MAG TPA: FG-GAP-like repeat-containing protein [Saprospiraceae bacterium]|nr:FG-GAP-like repeat-containing protein [Saprospiraceae bacterium]